MSVGDLGRKTGKGTAFIDAKAAYAAAALAAAGLKVWRL